MERKKRVPVPKDVDTEVLYAADYTCCVWRESSRGVQVHHIDEDPANNDIVNLAALCQICHEKTQIRGGFTKKLSALAVTRYRDAWLQDAAAKRAGISVQPAQERAREQAIHLRALYKGFLIGVRMLHGIAMGLSRATMASDENFDAYFQNIQPRIDNATALLGNTLFEIRIELGSEAVCAAFDSFQAAYRNLMDIFRRGQPISRFTRAFLVLPARDKLDDRLPKLEQAIRDHIGAVDRLT